MPNTAIVTTAIATAQDTQQTKSVNPQDVFIYKMVRHIQNQIFEGTRSNLGM